MRWLILVVAAIPAAAVWATLVFLGTANGWWREPLAPPGDAAGFAAAVAARLQSESVGNAAFRMLSGGKVAAEHYHSIGEPVTADTRFQMASVSKWLTAWGVLRLVQAGRVDLDAPVDDYLTRWQLPEGEFDNREVTARRLLSHTAGLTDGLGYDGFLPGTPVPSLEASLSRAADAMPGADGRTRVGMEPGSGWLYSGGGFALLALLIEEVSGRPFASYMQAEVLDPLGMRRSTFDLTRADPRTEAGPRDVATAYDTDGTPVPYRRFAAPSAAGLYSSAADLTRFLQAQLPGPSGEPPGRGVLAGDTLMRMFEPHASARGTDIWGLGVMLYAPNGAGGHVIGHEGRNVPAINTSVRLDPSTGNGVVLLVTGNPDLASALGSEWVFWQTGRLDVMTYAAATGDMIIAVAIGWIVIALLVVMIGLRVNQTREKNS